VRPSGRHDALVDRLTGDAEVLRDLLLGVAASDERDDLALPIGHRVVGLDDEIEEGIKKVVAPRREDGDPRFARVGVADARGGRGGGEVRRQESRLDRLLVGALAGAVERHDRRGERRLAGPE
jgi:hypothetical protein